MRGQIVPKRLHTPADPAAPPAYDSSTDKAVHPTASQGSHIGQRTRTAILHSAHFNRVRSLSRMNVGEAFSQLRIYPQK
ncbi:MAG: hypothetical protein IJK15_04140 [Bacteroidaceae bacterium]|nr:hypothetical protein [Bacteroidaceae bacterium]